MPATPPTAPEHLDRRAVMRAGAVVVGVGAFGTATLSGCGDDAVEVAATSALPSDSPTSVGAGASRSSVAATSAPASPTGRPSTTAARASSSSSTAEDEDDDSSSSTRTTRSTTKTSTKSTTKTSAKTSAKTSTRTSTTKAPQPVDVPLSDIPVGGAIVRTIKGRPIVLSRTGSSSVVGFDARCTHQGCPVRSGGGRLECPCHGSAFDLRSGSVLNGPASSPLKRVSVTVHDGGVSLA